MAKHIGIVACSAERAALCYRTICAEGAQRMGTHRHPEVSTHTLPLADYMVPIRVANWAEVAEDPPRPVLDSTRPLARAALEHALEP